MAITSITSGAWTSVTTTTEDTAFQNRGGAVMYLTVGSTSGVDLADGIAIPPGEVVVITSGKDVSVNFQNSTGFVYYGAV